VHFDSFHKEIKIEDLFSNALEITLNWRKLWWCIDYTQQSVYFCSRPLFDENFMLSAIQYQGFETDFLRMTKSVIIRLIRLYSLRKYEQLFYWSIWYFWL
jgi:hypothetical protein